MLLQACVCAIAPPAAVALLGMRLSVATIAAAAAALLLSTTGSPRSTDAVRPQPCMFARSR